MPASSTPATADPTDRDDKHTLWSTTHAGAIAIANARRGRRGQIQRPAAWDLLPDNQQVAVIQDAEAAMRAAFSYLVHLTDEEIVHFVRSHARCGRFNR